MFKKIFKAGVITALLTSFHFLDGFDITKSKFKIFHHLESQEEWGNLLADGYAIDIKAAELAEEKLHGGHYDDKIHTVIPEDLMLTEKEWKQTKDRIAQVIGPVPSSSDIESALWENSSKTVDELLVDAHAKDPIFKSDFQEIARQKGVIANFGPGNEFSVKSRASLVDKVDRYAKALEVSKTEAVTKIGDALRGTIIVDEVEKIPEIIALIADYADKQGAKVVFNNLWAEDRESGYVGIHAKLLLPVSKEGGTHYLMAEMQIHLDSIVDGTAMSAKERAHLIYENVRSEEASLAELSAASKLLFLTAMQEALDKFEKKTSG